MQEKTLLGHEPAGRPQTVPSPSSSLWLTARQSPPPSGWSLGEAACSHGRCSCLWGAGIAGLSQLAPGTHTSDAAIGAGDVITVAVGLGAGTWVQVQC